MQSLATLESRFKRPGRVEFSMEPWGYPLLSVRNRAASATLSLYGGHLMSYVRAGEEDILWLSKAVSIEGGKSIRGGIPVCWPWFGQHPSNASMPVHGLARVREWRLEDVSELDDDSSEILLRLPGGSLESPPFPFSLKLRVSIGKELRVALETGNEGEEEANFTAGLHSYFKVGDISRVSIEGLSGVRYWDKSMDSYCVQEGTLAFKGKVDRIYREISECEVVDPVLGRRFKVAAEGGRSMVVWNPGEGVERMFPGFVAEDYLTMLCVEAASPSFEPVKLEPGFSHVLATRISPL